MRTYWAAFIKEYEKKIPFTPINVILEAYFYYVKNENSKCGEIMNNLKK